MLENKSSQVVILSKKIFFALSKKQINFLNAFFNLGERYRNKLFFCHNRLAEISGCSVSTARRMLSFLEHHGLLEIEHRNYQSNLYHLSPTVFTPEFKAMMRTVFVAFRLFFPLYFLVSNKPQEQNEQLLNIKSFYLFNFAILSQSFHYKSMRFDKHYEAYAQARGEFPRMPAKIRSSEAMYNPIRPTIIDLKTIKLTQWGQIELEAYPDTAIEFAENKMRSAKNVRDRFKLFVSFCNEYCRQHQIAPSWRKVYFLRETYPKPVDAVMYVEEEKAPEKGTAQAKRQEWSAPKEPSESLKKMQAEIDRKFRERCAAKGLHTIEDINRAYVLPNLHLMPSWAVAEEVAAGRLPDCPETRQRIEQGDNSSILDTAPDEPQSTTPKRTDWSSMIGPSLEDHSTLGIFSPNGETDTQLPW